MGWSSRHSTAARCTASSEAISFFVKAETQEEIDDLWDKLTAEGEPGRCGWLKDKFGLSWQVVPPLFGELLADPDADKARAVMRAMLKTGNIHIEGLQGAYNAVA